ncbi:MAG: hypothetical protein H0T46_06590 [Deltaproteobacteria bacterium]|nr:hypothetical protein [Deltaproteobacteria bacterium]
MKIAAIALLAAACTIEQPPPEGEQVTSFVARGDYSMTYGARADVLFVVDNSPATAAMLPELRVVQRAMLERLATFDYGKLPDVHVAVATSDLADQGRFRRGMFLADALQFDLQRQRNYEGDFVDVALELLDVGTAGGRPQPIEAAARALSEVNNPGFVRHDQRVAPTIIFITAGDDTGTSSVEDLVAVLRVQGVSTRSVGALIGSCDATTPRLDAVLSESGARVTLCDPNPERLIDVATNRFWQTLEGRCLPGRLADVDSSTPGVQHECTSWLRDRISGDERYFPECTPEHPNDCWSMGDSPYQGCDPGLGLAFKPSRYQFPATAVIECVTDGRP